MPDWQNYFDEMTKMRWCTVIFIFLLYGLHPAVAREWGTLFRWQTDEGIRWMLVGIVSVHDRYEGQHQNGLPEGQGRMIYVNGESYAGEWQAGKYHGLGTLIRTEGSIHLGIFDSGLPHGPGEKKYLDGRRVQGEWRKGAQWNVTRFNAQGGIIDKLAQGEVVKEIDYGEVRYRKWDKDHWVWLQEGDSDTHGKYQGEVWELLPHGKGTYLSPLDVKYVGLWKDGLEHGQGTLTHPNGMRSVGEFLEGRPWNTVAYNKNGEVMFKVFRGKMKK